MLSARPVGCVFLISLAKIYSKRSTDEIRGVKQLQNGSGAAEPLGMLTGVVRA